MKTSLLGFELQARLFEVYGDTWVIPTLERKSPGARGGGRIHHRPGDLGTSGLVLVPFPSLCPNATPLPGEESGLG